MGTGVCRPFVPVAGLHETCVKNWILDRVPIRLRNRGQIPMNKHGMHPRGMTPWVRRVPVLDLYLVGAHLDGLGLGGVPPPPVGAWR